ncbi:MAG: hypothetical protein AAFN74_19760, partial [Myxococcota bacterium]
WPIPTPSEPTSTAACPPGSSPSAASSSSFGTLRTGPTPIEAPVEIDGELLYVDTDEVLNPLARYIRNAPRRVPAFDPDIFVGQRFLRNAACTVDFDNPTVLDSLPDNAQWTFAPYYGENCGDSTYAYVSPMNYDHFHLSYENQDALDCLASAWADDGCDEIDPASEPRYLQPHSTTVGTRLYVRTFEGTNRNIPFDLISFRVWGQPVDVCYKPAETQDGDWIIAPGGEDATPGLSYCWFGLPPGHYDVSAYVVDVAEVTFRSASNAESVFSLDDIRVQH